MVTAGCRPMRVEVRAVYFLVQNLLSVMQKLTLVVIVVLLLALDYTAGVLAAISSMSSGVSAVLACGLFATAVMAVISVRAAIALAELEPWVEPRIAAIAIGLLAVIATFAVPATTMMCGVPVGPGLRSSSSRSQASPHLHLHDIDRAVATLGSMHIDSE